MSAAAKRAAAGGRPRCAWPSSDISIAYHDREWGVPLKDDRKLFEFLVLDAAQAGLSWEIILRKRFAPRSINSIRKKSHATTNRRSKSCWPMRGSSAIA